jgi:biopolymer transport protein ExbB/TolQ
MTLYMVLFFLGFILAIGLLAYSSMQVAELNKKAEQFSKNLLERYSKPLSGFDEIEKVREENTEKQATEQ